MAEKVITGDDFRARNKKLLEEGEAKEKKRMEELKTTIDVIIQERWKKIGIIDVIPIGWYLSRQENDFLKKNEDILKEWLEKERKFNLIEIAGKYSLALLPED